MNVNIKDYSIVSLFHPPGKSKGGTTLVITKSIYYQKQKFQYMNNSEYCSLKITNFDQDLFIHSIYNHPNDKLNSEYIIKQISNNKHHIFLGDLNAHHKFIRGKSNNLNGKLLYNLLLDTDLIILNNRDLTFHHANGRYSDILDYAFVTSKLYNYIESFEVLDDIGSDHLPIFIKFKCNIDKNKTTEIPN